MERMVLLFFLGFFGLALTQTLYANSDGSDLSPAAQTPTSSLTRIVFLGDSLTEGLGVSKESAYPSLVGKQLKTDGYSSFEIVNAGISGSTSASAEGRLKWLLKQKPDLLILALGVNDGLRGVTVSEIERNLSRTLELAQQNHIPVLLVGMRLPPNYGKSYSLEFESMFQRLAKNHHVALIPFLLEGVAGHPDLNQGDGIHPNAMGHEKIAYLVTPFIEKLLTKRSEH